MELLKAQPIIRGEHAEITLERYDDLKDMVRKQKEYIEFLEKFKQFIWRE